MSVIRTGFLLAFTMLVLGFLLGLFAFGPLFRSGSVRTFVPIWRASFSAAPPASPIGPPPSSPIPKPRTSTPIPPTRPPPPTQAPLPTVPPTLSPISVNIQSYSLDASWVRPGQTVAVRYAIVNNSGRTVDVLLGASLKPSRIAGWGAAINDPSHDIVAAVPPGTSYHLRYFTVPPTLRAGTYDAAWGLKAASTGAPEALVTSAAAIRVAR